MNNTQNNNMGNQPQIDSKNLKTIEDQMNYESLLNKKCNLYAQYCNDTQLKSVCQDAANVHRQNFSSLKSYLDSHQ